MPKDPKSWIEEPLYTQIKDFILIPCVDLLIVHNNRLLLMLRNNEPGKDLWFSPGGRIHIGETLEEAVIRVLREETGLEPIKMEQKGTMSHIWPEAHAVTTYYKVEVDSDNVKMNDEHRNYKWYHKMRTDLHPYLKEMIEKAGILS